MKKFILTICFVLGLIAVVLYFINLSTPLCESDFVRLKIVNAISVIVPMLCFIAFLFGNGNSGGDKNK